MSKIAWKELIAGVAVGSIGTELKNKYLKRRPDVNDQLKTAPSKVKKFPRKVEETTKPILNNLDVPKILNEAEKALKPENATKTEHPSLFDRIGFAVL